MNIDVKIFNKILADSQGPWDLAYECKIGLKPPHVDLEWLK